MNATAAPASADPAPPARCRNCGVTLQGPHCHACGQPVKGLMRPLGSVFGDLLDSVFDLDLRVLRTVGPLFTKPGFLTLEYLAGRQVRYVTPFRLFFFLAVLAFFVARLTVQIDANVNLGEGNSAIASATTVEAVVRERDARLKQMDEAKREMAGTPAAAGIPGIEAGQQAIRDAADKRIRELQAQGVSAVPPAPPAPPVPRDKGLVINGQPWDADKHPIAIGWLPEFANRWLNTQAQHASDNVERLKKDPGAFKDAVLGAIPTTLFVLVPVFALLLKLAYVFKRRLYMEHLIVALHSHAFLCQCLLLVLLAHVPSETFAPDGTWLNGVFDWVEGLLLLWMPVYLLLMQKRVYGQGWPMTLLKYGVLGVIYSVLLAFAVTAAAMIGLVSM
ncbi:DUF3667 domain-containing protein [Thermomonas sp.]|uniref:DUF3667 domain-containing protein n=1 Tax=Thermomonas sp. TaxID=1971895 RepID=UPI0035AF02B8